MPDWLKKFTCVLVAWCIFVVAADVPQAWLVSYWVYSFLGVVGAIFANATGAGGGVIFVPFFNHLGFDSVQTVATSFAIQCCGMTAGALTWYQLYRKDHSADVEWQSMPAALMLVVPTAALGIMAAQYGGFTAPGGINTVFGIFSVVLAVAIFATLSKFTKDSIRTQLNIWDTLCLLGIGFFGGLITAWLSVGVGELIAVYLIMRGFNVTFSIAIAVIVSAFAVWVGVAYHGLITEGIYYQVVLFAGLGAILGGLTAKFVVLAFSPVRLKVFFASWVLILGVSGLPLF